MRRVHSIYAIMALLTAAIACDNSYLDLETKEELVVEGWIEDGHAPIVMVSTTLPVSSSPRPLSEIYEHIIRYASVYIEHNGTREDLTACISPRFTMMNYYTSATLRGKVGESYTLHVEWLDYDASATCTIPEPVPIDSSWFARERDSVSYTANISFSNNPSEGKYYQTFRRTGSADAANFKAVDFTALDGSKLDRKVNVSIMKDASYESSYKDHDCYFHAGDTVALKLSTMDKSMYDFWTDFTDSYNGTGFATVSASSNLRGNVNGALGYWAGYGVSMVEMVCP